MEEKVTGLLEQLGNNPDDIAAKLLELGCRGYRKNAACCPVANYLKKTITDVLKVGVVPGLYIRINSEIIPISTHLSSFIYAFDRGDYPKLIAY